MTDSALARAGRAGASTLYPNSIPAASPERYEALARAVLKELGIEVNGEEREWTIRWPSGRISNSRWTTEEGVKEHIARNRRVEGTEWMRAKVVCRPKLTVTWQDETTTEETT